jgi:tetratricopeptide (TPR) repeat protein
MDKNQLLQELKQALENANRTAWSLLADKAVSEFPADGFGYFYKGEYLLSMNDANAAIPFFTKAIELDSKSEYQLSLGLAKLQINDDDAAKAIFEKLLLSEKTNPDLYYALALCCMNESEEQSMEYLKSALAVNPNHINSLDLRVYFNMSQGKTKDALSDLNQLISIKPHNTAWRFQRIELLKKEDNREAIEEDFRFLIENHPYESDYRLSLGDYYMEIGAYADSIYCYCDTIDIEKRAGISTTQPYLRRATALLRRADYFKAIEDFKFVIKSDAEDADPYLGIADAYISLGKIEFALNYLEIALDIVYDSRWRLYEKQGDIALKIKDYDLAEAAFRGMTQDIQGKAEGYYQLGALYLRQGDMEMAYKALKESQENLHDLAAEMIEIHLQDFLLSDIRLVEKELQAEYSDEIENNAKSAALSKVFGKLWKLDEKTTLEKNSVLNKLPANMKAQILQAFNGMLFRISPSGLLIFNLGQEDSRAVYSINSESGDNVEIEMLPFGRSSTKELNLICAENSVALCGLGTDSAALDLYFSSGNFNDLSDKIQKNYKEKEASGLMDFLN